MVSSRPYDVAMASSRPYDVQWTSSGPYDVQCASFGMSSSSAAYSSYHRAGVYAVNLHPDGTSTPVPEYTWIDTPDGPKNLKQLLHNFIVAHESIKAQNTYTLEPTRWAAFKVSLIAVARWIFGRGKAL
ncbi:MAG TPA: hypothetical protein VK797_22995 [Tepidisphaeraceae bacterium]|jgi:hypothetical protein|nr:hypothetical protein [Tepidisphaeraceae bacterium]